VEDDRNLIKKNDNDDDTMVALECDWMREEELEIYEEGTMQESRVGKMLSDNTIKKVIIFVLLILICLPLFELGQVDTVNAQA